MSNNNLGNVISTRIRLARNVDGYPFPSRLKDQAKAHSLIKKISASANRIEEFSLYYMSNIDEKKAEALIENHLISPALMDNERCSAVLISNDKTISIMVNEEDHLREQCIVKGLSLDKAYSRLILIDEAISKTVKFAFDENLGYLTACPTNVGTGMRASVMMFLPATTINGKMQRVIRDVVKLGLTVRGVYGEGSEAKGYTYQISNEVTLGITEEEIMQKVNSIAKQLIEIETFERATLKNRIEIKDMCMRSFGILTNCARLTSAELIDYSAGVKLGAQLGYIHINDVSKIDDLVVRMQPANINDSSGRALTPLERDMYRAEECAKKLRAFTK